MHCIAQANVEKTGNPSLKKASDKLKNDRQWLGRQNGKGFYAYPTPAYEDPDFLK